MNVCHRIVLTWNHFYKMHIHNVRTYRQGCTYIIHKNLHSYTVYTYIAGLNLRLVNPFTGSLFSGSHVDLMPASSYSYTAILLSDEETVIF